MKYIIVDDEPLAIEVIKSYSENQSELDLVKTFQDPILAKEFLKKESIDLIFLDIQMPELTGIELIKGLKNPPLVIFTTAHPEFALEGYELNIIDYLLKPFSEERFSKAIEKAKEYFLLKKDEYDKANLEEEYVFFKVNHKQTKVYYRDIFYIEAFADYVKIYIPEKRLVTLQTMKNMENSLPDNQFCRVHRSYIVSLNHVDSYSPYEVTVKGVKLPIGKSYKDQFMERMKNTEI